MFCFICLYVKIMNERVSGEPAAAVSDGNQESQFLHDVKVAAGQSV